MNNTGCPVCKMPIDSDKSANAKRLKQLEEKTETFNDNSVKFNTPKIADYNKINVYKQILKVKELVAKNALEEIKPINEPGAITYSLPCQALFDRSFEHEIRRLEIENYNKKLLDLYENPQQFMENYDIEEVSN